MPFAAQMIAILREIQPLTEHRVWVFTSGRSPLRPMSKNAVLAALRSLSIDKDKDERSRFPSMARTILDEVLEIRPAESSS
jgi:hypothetical protein